jgi:protocatechuate 3,4-dioxygenase beta subunit
MTMKYCQLLLVIALATIVRAQTAKVAQPDAPSKITIAPANEPGEPLIVVGTVYDGAGKPLANASVYVYHTDARGYYQASDVRSSDNPRLRGWMRTDAAGRYEYRTIKPGPYPDRPTPAHIHYVVNAAKHRERNFEIVFEGDPFINDRIRQDAQRDESGYSIRSLSKDAQGIWRCTQDIRLRPE